MQGFSQNGHSAIVNSSVNIYSREKYCVGVSYECNTKMLIIVKYFQIGFIQMFLRMLFHRAQLSDNEDCVTGD